LSTRNRKNGTPRALGPLQRGQAVADLLKAGGKTLRQHMHVVAQRFGRGMEGLVGHHHGGRRNNSPA